MRRAGVALLAVAVLAGCSSHPATGRVVEKTYLEAYTSYVLTCMSYGKWGCTVWMPMPHTSGPFWSLDLTDGKEEWTVNTTPARFERVQVGDTFTDES